MKMNGLHPVSGLLVHIICLSSLDLVLVVTVRHNCGSSLFLFYTPASAEPDGHYVKIAGRVTSDLNSQLQGELGVDESGAQSLRGWLTMPHLPLKFIFCLATLQPRSHHAHAHVPLM